uniref:Uncharacterized protein n=1 Tax=Lotus japonicus TaxID=34305 RepID=I3SB64_LOTJA|nr:unknown [Lotus japonicus]
MHAILWASLSTGGNNIFSASFRMSWLFTMLNRLVEFVSSRLV